MNLANAEQLTNAKKALTELLQTHGWTLWAVQEASSGWGDGVRELQAIIEVRPGKIIKIKGGGYGPGWMVEGESGGWFTITLLDEYRKHSQCIYQVVGNGFNERFASREELIRKYGSSGQHSSSHSRFELQGQPILNNLVGPMMNGYEDGRPVIRYETAAAYEMYSR